MTFVGPARRTGGAVAKLAFAEENQRTQ